MEIILASKLYFIFNILGFLSLSGTGVISASGGDGACVPHCRSCKEKRRCVACNRGYVWKNYQCLSHSNANEPLVSLASMVISSSKPLGS